MRLELTMSTSTVLLRIALSCLVLTGCARNPVTGERELALISEDQELEMGRQAAEQASQAIGLVDDKELQSYVQRVGAGLAADSERPELPWSFQVVDDPTPNAFALPGGYIFVTRGMLNHMDSEAELAAVLGHEIAHVTARHGVQQMSRAQLAQLGMGLGMILVPEIRPYGDLLGSGLQLLFLKYGRDAERQADELGFKYALNESYDVRQMDDVFATLQAIGEREGGSPLPAWASSHPDPGERIENAQERLQQVQVSPDQLRLGREEFLTQIDGLVWGTNPRQGFFDDQNRFLHPELAFQLSFPKDWKTQNTPQAVVAASPRQDAMVQLTMAKGAPVDAARQFLSQQGVQPGQALQESVNGLPAVVARFRGQTQQGVLDGVAGFIQHGDRTYQVMAVAPSSAYAPQERLFTQIIGSFAPVTDPEILNVQPRKVDVVKLPRATTLAEFARTAGSSADIETLALINQVEPQERLPAGTLVKHVVGKPIRSAQLD
jgi:predicted Zn-dependent protease